MTRKDLWGFLLVLGTATTLFGYQALRGDQASRLFHVLAQVDPTLYRNDWYVQAYKGMNPHAPYFNTLGAMIEAVGLSNALQLAYLIFMSVLFIGSVLLYRALRPQDSEWAGWLAAIAVIFCHTGDLGTNPIFESQFKPRQFANALALLSFALLMKRPFRASQALGAGVFVTLALLAHIGVGILVVGFFGLVVAWWMFQGSVSKRDGAIFLLLDAAALLTRLPYLLRVDSRLSSTPDQIALVKQFYIFTHMGHFYPPSWPVEVWLGALALVLFALGCRDKIDLQVRRPLRSAGIIVGLLLTLGLVFSSVLFVYKIVLAQPFRLTTVTRAVLSVVLSIRLVSLWGEEKATMGKPRALFLLASLTNDWAFVVASVSELVGARLPRSHALLPWFSALAVTVWIEPKTGALQLIALALGLLIQLLKPSEKVLPLVALLSLSLPLTLFLAQRITPDAPWVKSMAVRWLFMESPGIGVEPIALWARQNTDPDAVFLTPPGVAGFRLWSRRAVVLDFTTPPLSAPEIRVYKSRRSELLKYLASHPQADIGNLYQTLTAEELLDYATRYGATHIVTGRALSHPRLKFLKEAGGFYLYETG